MSTYALLGAPALAQPPTTDQDDGCAWMRVCWVCGVHMTCAGMLYGYKKQAWCVVCREHKVAAMDCAVVVVRAAYPQLSNFAVASFSNLAGDIVDGDEGGREYFTCPTQSLHVFGDDPDDLARFNARYSQLEVAGLVETVPGTNLLRYRLSVRGKDLLA